jgi:hypothetical protein
MGFKKYPALLTQHFDKLSEFLTPNSICIVSFVVFAVDFGFGLSGLGRISDFLAYRAGALIR